MVFWFFISTLKLFLQFQKWIKISRPSGQFPNMSKKDKKKSKSSGGAIATEIKEAIKNFKNSGEEMAEEIELELIVNKSHDQWLFLNKQFFFFSFFFSLLP